MTFIEDAADIIKINIEDLLADPGKHPSKTEIEDISNLQSR